MTTTTNTTPAFLSTVIGVFPNHQLADQAIDELRHTNFSYERIRVVERGTGGFGDTLKGMFTGQASVASSTAENLMKMGLPDYEAQHYQQELDSDHVLVLMNADDRPEAAFSIMRQNGAFDINSRLRGPASMTDAVDTGDQNGSQAAFNPNTPPPTPVTPVAPTPDVASAERYPNNTQATYDPATDPATPAVQPTEADPDTDNIDDVDDTTDADEAADVSDASLERAD